jgi:F0F1-type ATP synthase membrane subunit b/b'
METLIGELLADVAAAPVRFTVEVAQSLLLLALLGWFGRRFAGRRLAERRAAVARAVAEADAAVVESAGLREEAVAVVERARKESIAIVQKASEQAKQERATTLHALDDDAASLVEQAHTTVAREQTSIAQETSDRLLQLTTDTARRYLTEILSETERRTLTQKAILETLERMERDAAPHDAGAA